MRVKFACLVLALTCAAQSVAGAESCTPVIGGMQFCAEIVGSPRVGERVKIALVTRDVELSTVSAISLLNINAAERSRLVWVWVNKRPPKRSSLELQREYVVHLTPGDSIRAVVMTDYVAASGRNEIFVEIPYWAPAGPPFTKAEVMAFHENSWPAPEVLPLLGPLVFDAR